MQKTFRCKIIFAKKYFCTFCQYKNIFTMKSKRITVDVSKLANWLQLAQDGVLKVRDWKKAEVMVWILFKVVTILKL